MAAAAAAGRVDSSTTPPLSVSAIRWPQPTRRYLAVAPNGTVIAQSARAVQIFRLAQQAGCRVAFSDDPTGSSSGSDRPRRSRR
jgi:hypothetical protein